MIQEAAGPGRRFRTPPLKLPCGRGVNFELRVEELVAHALHVANDPVDLDPSCRAILAQVRVLPPVRRRLARTCN